MTKSKNISQRTSHPNALVTGIVTAIMVSLGSGVALATPNENDHDNDEESFACSMVVMGSMFGWDFDDECDFDDDGYDTDHYTNDRNGAEDNDQRSGSSSGRYDHDSRDRDGNDDRKRNRR